MGKLLITIFRPLHLRIFGHAMSKEMERFVHNLIIVFTGSFTSSLILFLIYIIGGRLLGPAEYGIFQLIVAVSQILMVTMLLGINTATAKYISETNNIEEKEKLRDTSVCYFFLAVLVSTVVYWIVGPEVGRLFNINNWYLRLSIIFAAFSSLYYFSRALLQGYQMMKHISIFDLLYSLIISVLFICFFFYRSTFFSLYYAFLVGYLFFGISAFYYLDLFTRFQKPDFQLFKKISHYGAFAMVGSISGILLGNIDKLFLNRYHSPEVVGVYAAYLVASSIIFSQLVQIIVTVLFPTVSSHENKKPMVQKINKISLPLMVVSAIASSVIMTVILFAMGKSYPIILQNIILFSINAGILTVYQIKMWVLNAEGIQGVRSTVNGTISVGVVNMFLHWILIPNFGITGAAIATLIANLALYIYFTNRLNSIIKL